MTEKPPFTDEELQDLGRAIKLHDPKTASIFAHLLKYATDKLLLGQKKNTDTIH